MVAKTLSEATVNYDFEQLEPSEPRPRDAAERMLAQAAEEAQSIRERAHEEGRAGGHAAGLADIATAAASLDAALAAVEELRVATVEAVESDAVELALALAGKILAGALQARPELVVEVVQGALRRISDRRQITVLLNPVDIATVGEAIGDLQNCELQPEERVEAGGAIVRTVEGEVDARVATQLERAREVLSAVLRAGEQPA